MPPPLYRARRRAHFCILCQVPAREEKAGVNSINMLRADRCLLAAGVGVSKNEARMKETNVSSERKVAVITGASQGIGAALVKAYRDRGYGVVATARSIRPTNDDEILVVPGDISDRKTAERAISEGLARFGHID